MMCFSRNASTCGAVLTCSFVSTEGFDRNAEIAEYGSVGIAPSSPELRRRGFRRAAPPLCRLTCGLPFAPKASASVSPG